MKIKDNPYIPQIVLTNLKLGDHYLSVKMIRKFYRNQFLKRIKLNFRTMRMLSLLNLQHLIIQHQLKINMLINWKILTKIGFTLALIVRQHIHICRRVNIFFALKVRTMTAFGMKPELLLP